MSRTSNRHGMPGQLENHRDCLGTLRIQLPKILVFNALLVASLFLSGCEGDSKLRIENVLLRDALLSHQVSSLDKNRALRIAEKMKTFNLDGTPPEFKSAFTAHIQAWEAAARAQAASDKDAQQRASLAISATFDAVKEVAASRGAIVPSTSVLPAVASPNIVEQEAWVPLGSSTSGCQWSYQTPLKRVARGFRFWTQTSCSESQTISLKKKSVDYLSNSSRFYINCSQEKSWEEFTEYYDSKGKVVHRFEPELFGIKVQGPDMDNQGLGGTILSQNSLLRQVFKVGCS